MAELEKTGESQDAGAEQTPDLTGLGESGTHQDDETRQGEGDVAAEPDKPAGITIPEKFKGKSAEEIAVAYLEVEKEKGRLAAEQGELRRAVDYLVAERQARENVMRQQPAEPPAPAVTQAPKVDFWDNPETAVKLAIEREGTRIVNEQLGHFVQALSQAQVASNFQRASQAHEQGKSIMSKETRLFEGIEKDVERMVYSSLRPLAEAGQDVSGQLVDPQTWKMAAAMLRYQRGEYDRLTPNVAKGGMTPTQTNTPSATRPQEDEEQVEVSPEDIQFARIAGLSEKQAREVAQETAKQGRKR